MALLNADGSYSEVSGNGVRCLAAWIAESGGRCSRRHRSTSRPTPGAKRLELLERAAAGFTFRAAMGQPEAITLAQARRRRSARRRRHAAGRQSAMRRARRRHRRRGCTRLASRLCRPPALPARHERRARDRRAPDRVRILIWERGVGPTEASGTGACAAAVAAMTYGGASRDVQVVVAGRHPARRVARRRTVSDRLGRDHWRPAHWRAAASGTRS